MDAPRTDIFSDGNIIVSIVWLLDTPCTYINLIMICVEISEFAQG